MDGQLLVIGHDTDLNTVYIMSFSPEEAMSETPSGQRIDPPVIKNRPHLDTGDYAYGVLKNKNYQSTLSVAGITWDKELYCESYVVNKGWIACELTPYEFWHSIV